MNHKITDELDRNKNEENVQKHTLTFLDPSR